MGRSAFLVGRLDTSVSPPVLREISIASAPAGSMTSYGASRYVDLIPPGHLSEDTNQSYQDGVDEILLYLLSMQDYYHWMEPLMDSRDIERCLKLQGFDVDGIGYDIQRERFMSRQG